MRGILRCRPQPRKLGLSGSHNVHIEATGGKRPAERVRARTCSHCGPAATRPEASTPMPFKAEYIWIDGTEPTAKLRSKTKIVADGAELPIWGFDGSSTNQAPGDQSDCVLQPAFSCPDPIRGGDDVLVLAEVLNTDMTPHESNTRAALEEVAARYKDDEPLFGL